MDNIDIFSDTYKVSIYNGCTDTIGVVLPLATFLKDTKHISQIQDARAISDKKQRDAVKRTMPMAVIGGTCNPSRSAENTTPNGLICVDIDSKENPSVTDWEWLKGELSIIPEIAYIARSFSGNGLFLIIPLRYPQKFSLQFKQLESDFSAMGIVIDHACSEICRMRCLSYDPQPYINHQARLYQRIYQPQPRPSKTVQLSNSDGSDTLSKVASLVRQITENNTNITSNYDDWVKVGQALSDLGEDGREFFHAVSQMDGRYNEVQTDKKFNSFLGKTYSVGIGTFFHICKEYGIFAPQEHQSKREEQSPVRQEETPQRQNNGLIEIPCNHPDANGADDEDDECISVPIVDNQRKPTNGSINVRVNEIPKSIRENPNASLFALWDWNGPSPMVHVFAAVSNNN